LFFYKFFQTLVSREDRVIVELKNGFQVEGTMSACDQYLNVYLKDIKIIGQISDSNIKSDSDTNEYSYLLSLKTCFLRGSIIRFIHMKSSNINTSELVEAGRKEIQAEM